MRSACLITLKGTPRPAVSWVWHAGQCHLISWEWMKTTRLQYSNGSSSTGTLVAGGNVCRMMRYGVAIKAQPTVGVQHSVTQGRRVGICLLQRIHFFYSSLMSTCNSMNLPIAYYYCNYNTIHAAKPITYYKHGRKLFR